MNRLTAEEILALENAPTMFPITAACLLIREQRQTIKTLANALLNANRQMKSIGPQKFKFYLEDQERALRIAGVET